MSRHQPQDAPALAPVKPVPAGTSATKCAVPRPTRRIGETAMQHPPLAPGECCVWWEPGSAARLRPRELSIERLLYQLANGNLDSHRTTSTLTQ